MYLLLSLVAISISTKTFSQRPNFIIITLDDAHEESLPPDGPSFLNYPGIERIYQEGLQVCDAYCLMPLCNPSRYSMYTGMYPHVHGATSNEKHVRADLPTFFTIAASHGYHNQYVGKYSLVEGYTRDIPGVEKGLTITHVTQTNPRMRDNGIIKTIAGNTTVIIDDTTQAWLATIDTPFIFGVGHIGTHTPIATVSGYQNVYNGLARLPDNYYQYTVDYPSYLYTDTLSSDYILAHDSTSLKNLRQKLFEVQLEIDRGIQNIFSVLESRGILDNTMIIFTNDNGFSFGEHQLTGKGDATEPSAGVPLYVRYPAWFEPGTISCGNMMGLHDLFPTILEAAGIDPAPYNVQGQSLHHLLQPGNERTTIYLEDIKDRHSADSTGEPSWRAVRTPGFKYVRHHCQAQVEELFDLTTDPEENSNQVNNPAYADTLYSLRHLLDSLAIVTIDTLSSDTVYLPCTLISCPQSIFYADADGDGYGSTATSVLACTVPSGYVSDTSDCNDLNVTTHPGATDICNSIDDNCNGSIDEGCVPSITTGTISGSPFCPAALLNVPFTAAATMESGNIYTAQLSDKKGHFTSPLNIGTLSSDAGSGIITATLPTTAKAGVGYRIRVVSSNPVITGTGNGSNLQVVTCAVVTSLSVSGISATTVSLNWTGSSCAVKYKVQYRKQGTSKWTSIYPTTNSCTATGLLANTVYEYHVQAYCNESGTSKSATTTNQTFTTSLRVASDVSEKQTMSIHPNPAADKTVVQYSLSASSWIHIKVYDLSGKEIETLIDEKVEEGEYTLLLNTSRFLKGVYLVTMISDFGIENQKLVVE